MAHFAKLDNNNVVEQVIVIHNNELLDDGIESEAKGIQFCKDHYGQDTVWIQTSYNGNTRKNYAGIGYTYDANRDAFIAPKPFDSWVLNEDTCRWEAPIPYPNDGKFYTWDESSVSWVEITPPA